MEENKNTEIQDDETLKEDINTTNTEAEATEGKQEETANDKHKRHKGRRGSEKELEKALEAEKEKYDKLHDDYLRLFSEFDNFRKRNAKEKLDLVSTASEGVIKELLPIIDDFERALQNMEKNGNEADLQGVTLIYNKFKNTLKGQGLEEIEAANAEFNTDEHEALTMIPASTEEQKNKVVDVIQKGYKLNGKVIRFARVVVGN